jgi:hypothetical protein
MKHDAAILKTAKVHSSELLHRVIADPATPAIHTTASKATIAASGSRNKGRVGRPRKQGVERHACGQIKRSAREKDVRDVAIAQRVKRGVSLADSLDQRAADPLGRLALAGHISEPMRLAAQHALDLYSKLATAEGLGSGFARAAKAWGDESAGGGGRAFNSPVVEETADQVEHVQRCRKRVEDLEDFVRQRGGEEAIGWLRGLRALADASLDEKALLDHPRAMSCLRQLMSILCNYFRLGERR